MFTKVKYSYRCSDMVEIAGCCNFSRQLLAAWFFLFRKIICLFRAGFSSLQKLLKNTLKKKKTDHPKGLFLGDMFGFRFISMNIDHKLTCK